MINLNSVLLKIPYSLFAWFHNKKRERIHHSCPPPALLLLVSSKNVFFLCMCVCVFVFLFLGPHPIWIHASFFAHGHAVTHRFIGQIAIDCISSAIVHVFTHVILPALTRKKELERMSVWRKWECATFLIWVEKAEKKKKSPLRLPVIFLDFFISRGFKDVGPFVVFFVVAFAFWIGRHGELKWCLEFV